MNKEFEKRDICIHKDMCGGCVMQGISYEDQLKNKEKQVDELIASKRLKIEKKDEIEPSPDIYGYRNKMEYTFGDMERGGDMTLGMHRKGKFMSIVTVDNCQLVCNDFNKVLKAVLKWASEKNYTHYNKKSHKGLLRHLVLRRGVSSCEILVNIVTTSEEGFDEEGFVEVLKGLELDNKIAGILRTINDGLADAVKCDELKVLYGDSFYSEKIMGLNFKVSAFSFFQTNVKAVENLYEQALSLIDDLKGKTVFDLFCGTGTITQAAALKAKKAVGIEIVEEAVKAAEDNAKLNGLENCQFIAGDVFEAIDKVTAI